MRYRLFHFRKGLRTKWFVSVLLIIVTLFSIGVAENLNSADEVTGEYFANKKIKIEEIKLEPTSLTLKKGKSYKIKHSILPAKASNKNVKWATSNKKIATVDSKGKVKARGYGVCKIKCSAKDGSKVFAECVVIVSAPMKDAVYIGNSNTNKFHLKNCRMVKRMLEEHKVPLLRREDAKELGYDACQICRP